MTELFSHSSVSEGGGEITVPAVRKARGCHKGSIKLLGKRNKTTWPDLFFFFCNVTEYEAATGAQAAVQPS